MGATPRSAESIRQLVLARIRSGQYPLGSRMPTNRALAAELGVNRNTVNKALQALARGGLVSLTPGRGGGAFVLASGESTGLGDETLSSELRRLLQAARLQGLSRAHALTAAQQAVASVYDATPLRIKFLECNAHDTQTLAAQLARLLTVEIDIGVLDEEDLSRLATHYDLIITTFHHLAEVSRALPDAQRKIVGVNAVPTPETTLAIARLEGRRLGLICGRMNTVQSMKHLVASYRPSDDFQIALVDDEATVRALANSCEALIVTYSCADAVTAISGRQPDVVVAFQIEPQSIAFVRQRLHQLQQASGLMLGEHGVTVLT